ncbi:unnamed protein product [Prunus brigantina]
MDDNDFGDFGFDPYEFANVIGDGDQPLYPGCRKYTKLSALVKLYNLKAKHGMSDVCKDSILKEGVPAKVVWYFPPIPRFKRMLQSHETTKSLTWHAARKSIDGQMSHRADSPSWKLLDDKWPEFGNEPRNLRLALSSDGFNPHSSLSSRYSCWPPLIDDLKSLWDGIRGVYDAHNGEYFTLRAALMWTINDFPAYGNLSGCVVKGYKACPICGDDTPSHRLKNGHKICYIGHRKWLPINHPYRRQSAAFNRKPEYGTPPEPLTGEEVLHMVEDGDRVCWKKKSIFFDLEYWKYLPRYIAKEAVEFCTEHLSDVSTVGVSSSQNMGVSKQLSGCTVSLVDRDLLNHAHLYVLENTEEVLPYIEKHMIHIKTAYPKFRKRTNWLQDKHNSTFIQWLHFKVQSELNEEDNHGVSENLRWLAAGPNMAVPSCRSYLIKGDVRIECEPFTRGMPNVDTFDELVGEFGSQNIRDGCEDIWIE